MKDDLIYKVIIPRNHPRLQDNMNLFEKKKEFYKKSDNKKNIVYTYKPVKLKLDELKKVSHNGVIAYIMPVIYNKNKNENKNNF